MKLIAKSKDIIIIKSKGFINFSIKVQWARSSLLSNKIKETKEKLKEFDDEEWLRAS